MKQFRLVDNLMGWITFAIAAFVYCSTIEPTASFWDCPEFITTAYKLEVGHPPGAPFFMLTANLFTQFVSDPALVARMVNTMSALFSAACIMFLFWSISHLGHKLLGENGQLKNMAQLITVEASALTGALVYTFSDTFWFSAVEGEVYAYSSLFTAVVFWLMLKWEDHADEAGSDRWLILIAYLTGLSIGVHLLNLLCVPALVLIYYYKKAKNPNLKGALLSVAGSGALVAAVLYGIVPGIVKVGGWFELLFVNSLNCPFNTGLIIYIILLVAIVLWSIWETRRQQSRTRMNISYLLSVGMLGIPFYGYGIGSIVLGIFILAALFVLLRLKKDGKKLVSARLMNSSLLCMLMIMIGYSSYAVIVIRSSANTPMDQNSPEDIFTLGTYLSREQYGDRPLLYGQAYTSQVELKVEGQYCVPVSKQKAPVYQRKEKASPDEPDRYEIQRYDQEYLYQQNMFFPRMYSSSHAQAYESWMGGVKGTTKSYERCGEMVQIKTPTWLENLRFFLSYQVNFMYWRYFMWNFAGRQNDIQGNGEWEHGNWLTGIPFLDNLRLGDQSKLPSDLRENKGRNVFYCLPLLLGLLGLFWQLFCNTKANNNEGEKQFGIVFFLFFMTGLAIVIYLNQTPMQPRERDYAYAGSFYAFAIWVGLGVAAISDYLQKLLKNQNLCAALSCLCVLVPIQMASQTWDDHDRSGRYTCRDFGRNYLQTLSQGNNPIIFTNGDNDTFPLWYAQETEEFRTDARVCNLSYLQTDWYIDQMKRPAYDSPAVPIHWSRLQYVAGTREGVSVRPGILEQAIEAYRNDPEMMRQVLGDNPYELRNIIDKWVLNDNPDLQIFPTDSIVLTVDKEAVKRSGMMIAGDSIPDVMHISLKGKRAVYKSEMMMYEMLAQCNWERPLYVAITVGKDNYGCLGDYLVQEGLANRITPFKTSESGKDMDTDKMYENIMTHFAFGGVDNPNIYLDETVSRMCYTHRRMMAQLATRLLREGKKDKAARLIKYAEQVLPPTTLPHNYAGYSLDLARAWIAVGNKKMADQIAYPIAANAAEYINWYLSLPGKMLLQSEKDCMYYLYQMHAATEVLKIAESDRAKDMALILDAFNKVLQKHLYGAAGIDDSEDEEEVEVDS
ncbi:MAG: DUF2723 domain-containing protein [Bacteroidaceae bacterium]|nr:DUF2723 domain-containing protein [Bacteroidaceae bacterium]